LKLLFDTHIWLWSVSNPSRLARRVKVELSRSSNELWISPISAWELLILAERGRIKLDDEPRKWVIEAFTRTPAQEAAINVEIAVRSREIMARHPDPADRFLVATALVYGLTLVTADAALKSGGDLRASGMVLHLRRVRRSVRAIAFEELIFGGRFVGRVIVVDWNSSHGCFVRCQ